MGSAESGTPRWVKVFALVSGVLVLVLVVVLTLGGGNHGPSRHGSLGTAAVPTAADPPTG